MTLPTIYTLAEASERLRLNKNALARLARRTGHCSQAGRNLLFSESDLEALWEAMRVPAKPRTVVERAGLASRDTGLKMMVLERSQRPSAKRLLEELKRRKK